VRAALGRGQLTRGREGGQAARGPCRLARIHFPRLVPFQPVAGSCPCRASPW
jgi:hypothetical protein